MNGIIIAAGLGSRMGGLTLDKPKCMIDIMGRALLHHTIDRLKMVGCDEIVIIAGYLAERIDSGGCILVKNPEYRSNNILHSLMCAREFFDGDVICTYSDIWVEPEIYTKIMAMEGNLIPVIDVDWEEYYVGRTDHPLNEAENAFIDGHGRVRKIGKHLESGAGDLNICGEFLGLWRMNGEGLKSFVELFDEIDQSIDGEQQFQHAKHWRQAYITDLFQELIDRNHTILACEIERGWAELDTLQDVERLLWIAEKQKMHTLVN